MTKTAQLEPPPRRNRTRVPQRVGLVEDTPKGRILNAAAPLFQSRGFAKTTVRDLAAEVGILSGSLFHHFRSKEEILETVMNEVIALNTERMRDALIAGETPMERLRNLILCELTSINGETSQAFSLLSKEWRSLPDEARARVLVLRDVYEDMWFETIQSAQEHLVPMEVFLMRRFIAGILAGTGIWFDLGGTLSLEDLTDKVMVMLKRKETK